MNRPTTSAITALALCAGLAAAPTGQESGPQPRPTLFAEGLISTGHNERDGSRSADGSCFAYTLQGAQGTAIVLATWPDGGAPAELQLAPFTGTYGDSEPAFDPGSDAWGGRLLFASDRPLPGEAVAGDWNLWSVDYELAEGESTWAEPEPLDGLNSEGQEFYPSVALSGELVFTAEREGGLGGEDLWLARPTGDGWQIENAGPGVNTAGPEFNACLRPDGGALVFSSVRPGDQGGGDLYMSLRDEAGHFGPARALTSLNSPALDYCPTYSADGQVLWFTSQRKRERPPGARWESLAALKGALSGPGNGKGDIYWVRASALGPK